MATKGDDIRRIEELIARLGQRFGAEDGAEQQWLAQRCSDEAAEVISRTSANALHLLDAVPAEGSINIVGLSRATDTPKGTVSKTANRLVAIGALTRHRLPDNRKEVHLHLTTLGAEIQQAHRLMHDEMNQGLHAFFARYSTDELAVITRVLTDFHRMPREGLRFRPDLLD